MELNEYGRIVKNEWLKTSVMRPGIELGEYVIMPNHFHGIIIITGRVTVTSHRDAVTSHRRVTMHRDPTNPATNPATEPDREPTVEKFGKPTSNTIPTIVRGFKAAVTQQINIVRDTPCVKLWQRNYYEHIIRNEPDFYRITEYIRNNPKNWQGDNSHA
jgi:REP element-mobilizing transposase RayT